MAVNIFTSVVYISRLSHTGDHYKNIKFLNLKYLTSINRSLSLSHVIFILNECQRENWESGKGTVLNPTSSNFVCTHRFSLF